MKVKMSSYNKYLEGIECCLCIFIFYYILCITISGSIMSFHFLAELAVSDDQTRASVFLPEVS